MTRIASPAGALALLLLTTACPGPVPDRAAPRAGSAPHAVVIVMENKEYPAIIGSTEAPYINTLAERYALARNYHATSHPSLPNYIELIAGTDFGVDDDDEDHVLEGRTIVDQLERRGLTWRAYMEGMPDEREVPCTFPSGGEGYRKKHNPFAFMAKIQEDAARCRNVVPFTQLGTDLEGGLANYSFISPDLCHDMHDCEIAVGDDWLAENVPPILDALGDDDVLFLVFDEGDSDEGGGGHVVCIAAGPGAREGATSDRPYSHYSLLRTIEDLFGLDHLGHAADLDVSSMSDLLTADLGRAR